jgi:hypothetical protein
MNAYIQCLCFLSLVVKRQSGCDKIVMLQVHIEVAGEFKLAPRYLLKTQPEIVTRRDGRFWWVSRPVQL